MAPFRLSVDTTILDYTLGDVGDGTLLQVHAHGVVVGLFTGGIGGAGGGAVRGEGIGTLGGYPAHVLEIEVGKVFVVGKVSGRYLGKTGAVSNHENHVLGGVGGTVGGIGGMIGTLVGDAFDFTFDNFLALGLEGDGRSQHQEE